MAKTIVGLEVTEEGVRAAEISLGRKPQLIAYGEVPLPPEAARDSEVLDSGAVAVALRQLWTERDSRARTSYSASRAAASSCVSTRLRRCDPTCCAKRCRTRCRICCRCPRARQYSTSIPLSQEGDQVSGLLVAAVAENIEQIIATLSKVKLRAQAIDLDRFRARPCHRGLAPADETVATVNIGDHTTQVVVARGGVPQFVRLLPIDVAPGVPPPRSGRRSNRRSSSGGERPPALVGQSRRNPARSVGSRGAPSQHTRVLREPPERGPLSQVLVTGAGAAAEGVIPALTAAIDTPFGWFRSPTSSE